MGLSFKSIGRGLGKGLRAVGKGVGKVASVGAKLPGPVGTAWAMGDAAIKGENIWKAAAGQMGRDFRVAAKLAPVVLTGGLGAGAMGGAGAAGAAGGGGGALGFLKTVGGGLLNNADLLAGAGSMISGYKDDKRARDLQNRALALRERQYAETAPLRQMALSGLQNTQRRDLSSLFRSQQNPFAR